MFNTGLRINILKAERHTANGVCHRSHWKYTRFLATGNIIEDFFPFVRRVQFAGLEPAASERTSDCSSPLEVVEEHFKRKSALSEFVEDHFKRRLDNRYLFEFIEDHFRYIPTSNY